MKCEDLTDEEKKYLFKEWRCPDCGDLKRFLAGPRCEPAQNIMCKTCKSEFNVCAPFFAVRIQQWAGHPNILNFI